MDIRPASYTDILKRTDLLDEYAAECSIPEIGHYNPSPALYAQMEATGLMKTFGAYWGNDLVGFATILMFVLPHYSKKIANVESLFVARAARKGGIGKLLMAHIQDYARREGCKVLLYNAPAMGKLERLLHALRIRRSNSVFVMPL